MKKPIDIFKDRRNSSQPSIRKYDKGTEQLPLKERRHSYNTFNSEFWYLRVNYVTKEIINSE